MKREIAKHILASVICMVFVLNLIQPVKAQESITEIEYLSDGSYYLTEIQEDSVPSIGLLAANKTRTASATTKYCSASGNTLWYVKVTATFTYNGSTSSCTSASATAGSYSSAWKISGKSASRSGNKGKATATATQYVNSKPASSRTRTVTLTCDKDGNLS
ncbi:MAG TPA: hypothetical protein H9730_13370 [Candidatus Mediterraneibacter stercoripullorum]|nr:hypothetical protein [Candidatus Mediterraneibacter stercoripullorum]